VGSRAQQIDLDPIRITQEQCPLLGTILFLTVAGRLVPRAQQLDDSHHSRTLRIADLQVAVPDPQFWLVDPLGHSDHWIAR
jgi:hypothetical protein